jgi:hypothetical protein
VVLTEGDTIMLVDVELPGCHVYEVLPDTDSVAVVPTHNTGLLEVIVKVGDGITDTAIGLCGYIPQVLETATLIDPEDGPGVTVITLAEAVPVQPLGKLHV